VYDGHCGDQAATFLQDELHPAICGHPAYASDLERAIVETCVAVDKRVLTLCQEKRWYCGTTAIGAFVRDTTLTVFNIGDCHAVLGLLGGGAEDMSRAHKPGRPDEAERIAAAKGWITEEKELYVGRLHMMDLTVPAIRNKAQEVNWVTIHRVCGELAISRSIGDPDYKNFVPGEKVQNYFAWPDGHDEVS
jgi:serine/threonine protein phosphatase PrpC